MAIETNLNFYLAIWQTIILGLNFIVMASSIKRYTEKKSDVAAKLSIAFIFFFLANLFNVIGIWRGVIGVISTHNSTSFPGILIELSVNYVFAYDFLILGVYFIYQFSVLLNRPDVDKKKPIDYVAIIGSTAIIIYGFVLEWLEDWRGSRDEITQILTGIDIYVVLLALILILPMLITSIKLLIRLEKNSTERSRVIFMLLLSIFLFLLILSFILETVYQTLTGLMPNFFSFVAWAFVILAFVSAYFSFYKKTNA